MKRESITDPEQVPFSGLVYSPFHKDVPPKLYFNRWSSSLITEFFIRTQLRSTTVRECPQSLICRMSVMSGRPERIPKDRVATVKAVCAAEPSEQLPCLIIEIKECRGCEVNMKFQKCPPPSMPFRRGIPFHF